MRGKMLAKGGDYIKWGLQSEKSFGDKRGLLGTEENTVKVSEKKAQSSTFIQIFRRRWRNRRHEAY